MGRAVVRNALAASFLMGSGVLVSAGVAPGRSTTSATELVSLMKSQGLATVAATDPERPGRIIAAMLIPDVQLLVVAANSTAQPYLEAQIAQRQYGDVYATLNSTAVLDTKLFLQDMGCDGLTEDDGAVDVMYEGDKSQTVFNGDWKRQKLSKAEYEEKLHKTDGEYSRMLTLLAHHLKTVPGASQ